MKCDEIVALAVARTLGVLEDTAALDEHLRSCSSCQTTIADAERAMTDETSSMRLELPKDGRAKLEAALASQAPAPALPVSLRCTFCHDALDRAKAVYCAACLAPHHAECRDEHGKCAAPGCGERKIVEPREPRRRFRWWIVPISVGVAAGAAALVEKGPIRLGVLEKPLVPDSVPVATGTAVTARIALAPLGLNESRRVELRSVGGRSGPVRLARLGENVQLELPVDARDGVARGLITARSVGSDELSVAFPGGVSTIFSVGVAPAERPHDRRIRERRERLEKFSREELEARVMARRDLFNQMFATLWEKPHDPRAIRNALRAASLLKQLLDVRPPAVHPIAPDRGELDRLAQVVTEREHAARTQQRQEIEELKARLDLTTERGLREAPKILESLIWLEGDECSHDAQLWLLHRDDLVSRGYITGPFADPGCSEDLDPFAGRPASAPLRSLKEPPVDAHEGELYEFTPVIESDRIVDSFVLVRGPVGMTIDPATGGLRWRPDQASVGKHDVVVGVKRGAPEIQVVLSFTLTVHGK